MKLLECIWNKNGDREYFIAGNKSIADIGRRIYPNGNITFNLRIFDEFIAEYKTKKEAKEHVEKLFGVLEVRSYERC